MPERFCSGFFYGMTVSTSFIYTHPPIDACCKAGTIGLQLKAT